MKCSTIALVASLSLCSSVLAKDHTVLRRQHRAVARSYDSESSSYGSSDSSYGSSYNAKAEKQYYDNRAYGGGQYDEKPYGEAQESNFHSGYVAAAEHEVASSMGHETSSSVAHGARSTAKAHEASSTAKAQEHETSKVEHVASSTSSAHEVKQTQYGSGYVAPSYDSCVQTCQATYGQSIMGSPKEVKHEVKGEVKGAEVAPPAAEGTVLVAGPGQVVVAPIKGDLRFVPFAIEGSSVEYVWGAGPHTVTQSSTLALCNATLEEGAFKSGQQNATFKFNVEVKDTSKPTWVFCGVATHCVKGMFSVINPAKTTTASASFGAYMDKLASTDAVFAAKMNETKTYSAANSAAWRWGSMYDIAQVPEESRSYAMYNTLATRVYFTDNPQLLSVTSAPANTSSSTGTTSATFASGTADAEAQSALSGASSTKLSVLAAVLAGVVSLVLA